MDVSLGLGDVERDDVQTGFGVRLARCQEQGGGVALIALVLVVFDHDDVVGLAVNEAANALATAVAVDHRVSGREPVLVAELDRIVGEVVFFTGLRGLIHLRVRIEYVLTLGSGIPSRSN